MGSDELIEVFIAGNDDRVHSGILRLHHQRAYHIVCLVPINRNCRHVKDVEELRDPLQRTVKSVLQLGIELLPRGLVVGIGVLAE